MLEDESRRTALDSIPTGYDSYVCWRNIGTASRPEWRLFIQTIADGVVLSELSVHANDAAPLAETILRHAVQGPIPLTDGINIQ